jgi:hypothetical protein
MQLLAAWKDSFAIFKPKNFANFIANFTTTFTRTWITWVSYWLWLIAIYLFAGIYRTFYVADNLSTPFTVRGFSRIGQSFAAENIFASILLLLLYVTLYLSAKSLPARKSYAYFFFYIEETFILGLWFLIVSGLWDGVRFIEKLILRQAKTLNSVGDINVIVPLMVINAFLLFPLFCFSSFYITSILNSMGNSFFNTQKKALTQAFFLTLYTVPITAIMITIGGGIYVALYAGGSFIILRRGYNWQWIDYLHMIIDLLIILPAVATL